MQQQDAAAASAQAMAAASALVAQGELAAAEQRLLAHLRHWREDTQALLALAAILIETGRKDIAVQVMERLISLAPTEPGHHLTLAALLRQQGRHAELVPVYQRMCAALPSHALAHFNLGCALRGVRQDEDALAAHRRALALGIEQPEECWSNIAAILADLHRDADSREALEQALAANPRWVPARYNLGLWFEEHGERAAALEEFRRVLEIDPAWHDARVRIAWLERCHSPDEPLIGELRAALAQPALLSLTRENLQFALGKSLEDCGQYEEAFAAFAEGNRESRSRLLPYDRAAAEALFARIRTGMDADWLRSVAPVSEQPLVFVCGMFRSGSTLLEQMLAAHPAITAGGEVDWFARRLMYGPNGTFPERAIREASFRTALGAGYMALLAQRFPGAARITDKRPDNFLYIGLLAALFPRARFLNTVRNARDTCVSIWCQQLEDGLGYAADLADTAHYLGLYRQLMSHWQALLPGRVLDVGYEDLVKDPTPVLHTVCDFLDLPWQSGMLEFHAIDNRVRTASLWQVRQPLYTSSTGRWRRYAAQLQHAFDALEATHGG